MSVIGTLKHLDSWLQPAPLPAHIFEASLLHKILGFPEARGDAPPNIAALTKDEAILMMTSSIA